MADILSREAILAVRLRHEVVEVPEWGGSVYVWELPAIRKFDLRPQEGEDPNAAAARLVAACVGDEQGPASMAVENLGSAYSRLAVVALRLNVASAEAAEDVRKNSQGEPTGASPTGSP